MIPRLFLNVHHFKKNIRRNAEKTASCQDFFLDISARTMYTKFVRGKTQVFFCAKIALFMTE
ncbi:hypothetical protein BRYFOR_09078 [Marvinbryantia formatexigens DSM 14469]|uniref:Uncharacterized protein n=1 Tax=Marvinbryantia formatexigens DSM 14469 TaxID=478749 RepID=C6LK90_9FIRM|nr:hypothetical protein BRYFOR_09078 [Marvinbryantia formatexigens DSM 14469]